MTKADKQCDSAIGLDIGTSRIVLARRRQQDYEFEAQRNAYVRIPFSGVTRNVFDKERVPYSLDGKELVVFGNEAENFANLFHAETRRPMVGGALNPGEPEGPEVIRQIVVHLAGNAAADKKRICVSMPGTPIATGEAPTYHEAVLRRMLSELGYEVMTVNEGLAVVYSELESTNFTGIGVSCGGGLCNICLAYLSVPVACFSIPEAGDYIDARSAAQTLETATRVRMFKEQTFHLNGNDGEGMQKALTVHYDRLISALVKGMCEAFSDRRAAPRVRQAVPLVVAGGTAMPAGFRDRLDRALKAVTLPVPVTDVRLADDPLNATAKGALVAALAAA